jgi:hypothetical protein
MSINYSSVLPNTSSAKKYGTEITITPNHVTEPKPRDINGTNMDKTPEESLFGEDGFGFGDFLDLINPLQHIPVVGTIYRRITGDDISAASKVVGGAIFGGAMGLAFSAFDAVIKEQNGKDLGETVLTELDKSFGGNAATNAKYQRYSYNGTDSKGNAVNDYLRHC